MSNWIKITDRLPELIHRGKNYEASHCVEVTDGMNRDYAKLTKSGSKQWIRWCVLDGGVFWESRYGTEPTHWRELPELPKE